MSTQKINLYVDDLRDCTIARNIEKAIYYLENHKVHILSLDHDLGEDINGVLLPTDYDLVKYMCQNGLYADKIYLHTDNGVGRENMYQTLKASQRRGFISGEIEIYHYPITKNTYSG
ncbi:cyclic-phosphate processing receiver domain-containing protein [Lysinibacillus sp. CTST325]